MKLSLIDLSPVPPDGNRSQAIANTLETAQRAEALGYTRIWLAEHHNAKSVAGRAPEVLIPYIASKTKTIRVGSGSVLLNHYSPFKVSEVFNTLEDMFPGRIDMGIGRATTGPLSDLALQRNRSHRQIADDSDEQLAELLSWQRDDFTPRHPFNQVHVYKGNTQPAIWLLGSSAWSAAAAASHGLPYAFAAFINPGQSYAITQTYLEKFRSHSTMTGIKNPELILAMSVYCAETEELAAKMAAPMLLMMKRMMQLGDITSPLATEDEAVRLLGGLPEIERVTDPQVPPRYLIGTPHTIKRDLETIAKTYGAEEIMIQCVTPNHNLRLKSLELLSEAFALNRI